MNTKLRILFVCLIVYSSRIGFAQSPVNDFYEQMKNYNLSVVIAAEKILADEEEMVERAPILGFIGDNYQRFHIHFISVIQNPKNPYEYFAYGKTKVKNTICSFQGTIKVIEAKLYIDEEEYFPEYKQGYVTCEVLLFEDNKEKSTGFIKGNLESKFLIDNKGEFRYDALFYVADGFSNNQFTGTWTSYKSNIVKKCNWGDCRIPESEALDCGVWYFFVDERYIENGWKTFWLAYNSFKETEEVWKARKIEDEKWWK